MRFSLKSVKLTFRVLAVRHRLVIGHLLAVEENQTDQTTRTGRTRRLRDPAGATYVNIGNR